MTQRHAPGAFSAFDLFVPWLLLLLFSVSLATPALAQTPDDPAVFPTRVYQSQATPDAPWRTSVISVPRDVVAPFTLRIANGTQGGAARATQVWVRVNGVEVLTPADIPVATATLERLIVLNTGDNTLDVRVDGAGSEVLALSVTGTRATSQPSIVRPEAPVVPVGGSATLEVRLTPPATSDGALAIGSSDAAIVRVPASVPYTAGTSVVSVPVSGAGPGTATVSVAGNGGAVTRTVSVVREAARPIGVDLPGAPLLAGSSAAGEVRLSAAAASDVVVVLASSNPSVAAVPASTVVPAGRASGRFRVDALTAGAATITAQIGASAAQAPVSVTPLTARALSIAPSSTGIELGGHGALVVRISPPQPRPVTVALSVEPTGLLGLPARIDIPAGAAEVSVPFRGTAAGLATVSAATSDTTAETAVQVVPSQARLAGIAFAATTLARGSVTRATLTVPVAQTTNTDVLLSVSPGGIVGVPSRVVLPAGHRDVSFEVRAIGAGTAALRATPHGGSSLDAPVSVSDTASPSAEWLPAGLILQTGAQARLTLRLPGAASGVVTVSLSAAGTGAIDLPAEVQVPAGATGTMVTITGRRAGEVTLRAISGTTVALARLRIEDGPAGAGAFDAPSLRLAKGRVGTLAFALDRASRLPVTAVLESSDPSVAAVPARVTVPAGALSADVPVRALGTGAATVRASIGGTTVTTSVEVAPAELDNLAVTPMTGALHVGDTRTLALRGTLSDGTATAPVSGVTWETSDPAVATVSADGVVVAAGPGAVRITAFASGLVTQSAFTVARRSALSLSPGTATYARGTSRTFTVDAGTVVTGQPLEVVISQSGAGRVTAPPVVSIPAGSRAASFTVTGDAEGVLLLRASASGFASVSSALEITAPPPTITGFSPARAPAGGSVIITGDGFSDSLLGNRVSVGGVDAVITSATPTRLVILVPAGVSRGAIAVQNARGAATGGELVVETANALGQTANVILTADGPLTTTRGVFTPVNGAYLAQGSTVLIGSGSPNDRVTYLPQTSAGTYKVFAWWPRTAETTGPADIVVTHRGGTSTLTVDQSRGAGLWHYVGAFEASSARPLRVELRGRPGTSLVADAMRFEYAPGSALGLATPAAAPVAPDATAEDAARTATTALAPPSPTSTGTALAELLSMIAEVPEGSWVQVNLNRFQDVWTPLDQRPYFYPNNPGLPSKVLGAWGSVAWDTNRGDLYAFGGGHANYSGNEVYRWRGSTLQWERLSLPSEITQDALANYMAIDGPNNAPPSAHTYDNNIYLPVIDRFVAFGGAAYNNGGRWEMQVSGTTERPYGPFFFDQSRGDANRVGGTTGSHVQRNPNLTGIVGGNMWENRDIFVNIPGGVNTEGVFRDGCTEYHQVNGKDVVYIAQTPAHGTGYRLYEYVVNDLANPALDTWRWIGREPLGTPGPFSNTACGFDPNLNIFVRRGDRNRPFVYWDLSTAGPGNVEVNVVPQDPTGEFTVFINGSLPPGAIGLTENLLSCGFEFDPTRRQYLMWCGDSSVWVLTPPATVSPNGWVIRRHRPPVGTPTPNGEVGVGILGKWRYAANVDAFLGVQDENEGQIWFYKPIGWQPPVPVNLRPSVQLTQPVSGASVSRPNDVQLAATASDPDGTVARVEFYAGTTKIGEDPTAPYMFTWQSPPQGTYSIVARAVDQLGLHRNSAAATFTVAPAPTVPPTVRLVRPSNSQNVTVGVPVTLEASAADTDGTIAKVEFYLGATKLGEDTTAPYTFSWTPPSAGAHVLTAFAIDNLFGEMRSTEVTVNAVSTPLTTVTLQDGFAGYSGTRDAWLYDAQPTANTGALGYLQIAQSQFENLVRFAIFQSEGGPVPDGAVINSARLHVYKYTDAYDATYRAFRLLRDWDEATVTFNQRATGQPWAAAGARAAGTDFLAAHDGQGTQAWNAGWVEIDVTGGVQQLALNPTANFGWKLAFAGGNGNIKQYHSSEYTPLPDLRPKLVVSYQPPVGPQVSITSPVTGTTVNTPVDLAITANAFDSSGGTITRVEFFAGTTRLGEDTSAPYAFTWADVQPGTYTLTAVATSGSGATRTSAPVSVTVKGPNVGPAVSITQPGTGAQLASGAVLNLLAAASDPDGTVVRVEFFQGATKIGEDTVAPYAASWIAPTQTGIYTFTAVATDELGAQTTSAPITVTVTAPAGGAISTTLQDGLGGYGGTRDAYLYDFFPDGNAGAIPYLQIAQNQFENLIRFAIFQSEGGPVPDGSTITSAVLGLYKSTAYDATYRAHRLLQGWDESSVTFNSRAAGLPWTLPGARGTGTDFLAAHDAETTLGWDPGWLELDVTGAVQAFATGTSINHGWKVVMSTGNGNIKQFHASEFEADPALRPRLMISYLTSGPQVSLTAPASGTAFTAPATIALTANATDSGGSTITRVEFFAGTTKIGEDTAAPYAFTWTNVPAGSYALTAAATNAAGVTRTSAAVTVSVAAPNAPPTVGITAPAPGASVTAGSTVTVQATAADTDGSVARVEFFAGATKIGEDTTAPYAVSWTVPGTAGPVSLTAVATDNAGALATSPAVSVSVTTANAPPTVALTAPSAGSGLTAGTTVTLQASAADSDGTVQRVEFFAGTTKIGEDTTSPYALSWTVPAAPGAVTLTAVATDNAGAQTTSPGVSVNILAPTNAPPTVAITAPANNATVTAGAVLTLEASAADADGSVARVEFYQGATRLGEDTTAPYSIAWTAPSSTGSITLTAVAVDNAGAQTTSTPVSVSVAPASGGGGTVTLQDGLAGYTGTRDARLYFWWPTSNLGNQATLQIAQNRDQNLIRFAIFQSEGGPVPDGATITSATLSIYKTTNAYEGTYRAHRLLQGWEELQATWNSRATGMPWTVAGANGADTDFRAVHDGQGSQGWNAGWLDIDVTPGVQAFASGAAVNHGWKVVMSSGNGNIKDFASSEYTANLALRPKLVVTYAQLTGPQVSLTSPAAGATFTAPATVNLAANATDASGGAITRVEYFAGSTKIGEALAAPWTFTWNAVPVGAYTLTAVATSDSGATRTSAPVVISVGAANAPPSVALNAPGNGASFGTGTTVALAATASDTDGTVQRVEFFAGTTKIGEDTTSPYTLAWTAPGVAGPVTLTAVAVDNAGARTTSAPVSISVTQANVPPSVAITTPVNGAMVVAGATIGITAQASDPDGTVARVEFFSGSTKIGEATSSPFAVSWMAPATAGSHVLTAVAHDNAGASATSAGVTVSVVASGGASVTLQEGLNGYAGTRDAHIYVWWPTANLGNAASLQIAQTQFENLIRFAIFQSEGGPVPNGATITSARLGLYKYTDAYEGTYRAFRLLQSWDESQVTWNVRSTGLPWTLPGARGSGTDFLAAHDAQGSQGWNAGWLELDVTAAVQAFSTGSAANHGWKIVMSSGNGNIKQFHSSEALAANAGLRPRLVITYSVGQ